MAAPSYATDLVSVNADAESTTNWNALGGGGAGLSADVDFAIEPTNCITKQVSGSGTVKGMVYDYGSTRPQATDDHIYQWIYCTTPGLLDTLSNGGMRVTIGTGTAAFNEYYIRGATEYAEGGWLVEAIKYVSLVTPSPGRKVGSPGTAPQFFGGELAMTGTVKAVNFGLDVCYEGSKVEVTAGDATTSATWDALAAYAHGTTRRWGLVRPTAAGAALQGKIHWGTAAASCYARDSNRTIEFTDTPHSLASLTEVIHNHASSNQEFLGMTFIALGTNNPGKFTINNNAPVNYTGSVFQNIGTFTGGGTNTVLDGCTFQGCKEVDTGGAASVLGASFLVPSVAGDGYALGWNVATDPDGYLDGCEFSKGTTAHHAIEFGASTPTTITLRNIDFTGFSGTGNSAALNFLRTSGTTTVNLVGCTGTITAQLAGTHTVNFVINPVTLSVTVQDVDGVKIENARVYVIVADVASGLPYQDSVTIARSGSTATVTHTAHGFTTGQKVLIEGTGDWTYFGTKTITVTGANTYTYTVTGTPADPTSCTATAVLIDALTNASGVATDSRSYSVDQPIDSSRSRVRKSSSADDPKYKTSSIAGTVDSGAGLSLTIQMIKDE